MGEVKLFRLSGSAAVIDLRTGNNATLRPGLVVLSEDAHTHAIATLEAENAKLRAELERRAVDGWKLVPVEPTEQMANAYWDAYQKANDTHFMRCYRAMLAAAPSAPKADDPVKCNCWRR